MVWIAQKPYLTTKQSNLLEEITKSRTVRQDHILRSKIILQSFKGMSDLKIAKILGINRKTVGFWRNRWLKSSEKLSLLDEKETGIDYKRSVLKILSDEQRPGTPCKFTPEQICQIINVSCERPDDLGLPLSHWSLSSLGDELVRRNIVNSISTSQLSVFLKSSTNKTT